MARNQARRGNRDRIQKADWTGYANIDLSAEDKQAIQAGVLDGESVLEIISEMLGTGHKVTLSYDPEKDTVTAAATGVYRHCQNAGLTLTSFARDLTAVLTVVAYKHQQIAKGDWKPFTSAKRDQSDIG